MTVAIDAKRSMDRADEILELFETGGMSDFTNLPPIDGRTLLSIIVKVTDETKKAARSIQASENAKKGHEKGNAARTYVLKEWAEHKDAYAGNKSAFARAYVRFVKRDFTVDITEKQMREVWLKDTPPASKRAGKLADG